MPKTREQKEEMLQSIVDKVKDGKSVIVADYTGLTVADSQALREKCKEEDVEFLAVKKTLLKKAFEQNELSLEGVDFEGSLAIAIGTTDEVAPAKILHEFSKDHENVSLRAGVLEGAVIGMEKVQALAALPSKPELYAKIVGSLNAPISGIVNVFAGVPRGLVNVLNAIKDSKE
jgi:large subunit ribosomal protein L10